jgi:hypothetical protein
MNADNNHGFTRSQIITYKDGGWAKCPFCGDCALAIKDTEVFCGEAFADIVCESCSRGFTEHYVFADIFVAPDHDGGE